MSVAGIDFGNQNCVLAVVRQRGIDVIANEASRRESPSIVGFKEGVRALGEAGATQRVGNLQNTVADIKRLIGRKFKDADVQAELPYLMYKVVEIANGNIGIEVLHEGKRVTFTPEQITAMLLQHFRQTIENETKVKVLDSVITIPGYFTDAQRRAMKDAAEIAGLNCLKLVSEPAAVALHYASKLWKKEGDSAQNIMFIDLGQSALTVTIAQYEKSKCKLLATAYDPNLGGRNFDRVLAEHFADEFKGKYKIDVRSNPKAMFRLEQACERLKNILTVNPEAPISVENIMNDVDVKSTMSRDKFEELSAPLFERVGRTIQRALEEAGVSVEQLNTVELVGGASRIPKVTLACQDALGGRELKSTMNKSECVALGAALQCAMLSPHCMVRDLSIQDCYPYSIKVEWGFSNSAEDIRVDDSSAVLFQKNSAIPSGKKMTFARSEGVHIRTSYANMDELPLHTDPFIANFYIPPYAGFAPVEGAEDYSQPKIEVKLRLDQNGILNVEYVQAVQSYFEPLPPAPETPASPAAPAADGAAPAAAEGAEGAPAAATPEGGEAKPAADGPAPMDTQPDEEKKRKRKTRRADAPVQSVFKAGLSAAQIKDLARMEIQFQQADFLAKVTADARNNLESYVYDMRSKLEHEGAELREFATEAETTDMLALLDDTVNWLYGEGEDTTKEIYDGKLSSLKAKGDPLDLRRREAEGRPEAVERLKEAIVKYRQEASSDDEKYSHIDQEEKQKILDRCNSVEEFLNSRLAKQNSLPRTADPVLLCHDLYSKIDEIEKFAKPILSKPKPIPKEEPKKEEPAAAAAAPADGAAPAAEGEGAAPAPTTESGEPKIEEVPDSSASPAGEAMEVETD